MPNSSTNLVFSSFYPITTFHNSFFPFKFHESRNIHATAAQPEGTINNPLTHPHNLLQSFFFFPSPVVNDVDSC
ncbi:hypothetical protein RIF29_10105 [Crotalaria pallida]|uniref:Uncharacterized protein n=1 Tax=Crotalaria pallida TaxID=3830 RepID=A0AAN9FVN3_CROPI